MENQNIKFSVAIAIALVVGAMMGRSSPVSNNSNAENNVTINQEIPENFEKNSKKLKNFENFSKKLNINEISKYDLMELPGIGEAKADAIILNRPYNHIKELRGKGVLGYYSYENNKDIFTVGD